MKIFRIQPRQTGKTTSCIYKFLEDPKGSLLLGITEDSVGYIKSILNEKSYDNRIITYDQYMINHHMYRQDKIKTLILDEYLYYPNNQKLYDLISSQYSNIDIFIATSPYEYYDNNLINLIKLFKEYFNIIESVTNSKIYEMDDIKKLIHNFITDPDVVLIDKVIYSPQQHSACKYIKNWISDKQFDLEYNNKYLK